MGLLRGMARTAVVAGTATAVSNRVSRRQASRWDAKDAQQTQEAAPQDAAPQDTSSDTDEQLLEIQKFATLRDQGVLTEEEFSQKKAQILGL